MQSAADIMFRESGAMAAADVVLGSALSLDAGVIRVEPAADRRYQVRCESGGETVAVSELEDQIGAAVVLRLAAVAGLDPVQSGTQVGRLRVRCEEARAEVLVCSFTAELGPAVEILVLGRLGQAGLAREPELPEELEPGMAIGPYRVVDRIGSGGMGAVYRIEHRELQRMFALKVMHRGLFEDNPEGVELFVREGRAAARVRHSGVVDVSDCGRLRDGRPYLVMELLAGVCLEDMLRESGALRPERAVSLLGETARALRAAHACGVVHRDISTSNLFVESGGDGPRVKLIDFGVATMGDPADWAHLEPEGGIVGTPCYVPPERVRGKKGDARSDIYSLGIVFYELLTGDVPFCAPSVRDILVQHLTKTPPRPESPFGEVPEEIERVLGRMLAKDPDDRYQSLDELIADLDELKEKKGPSTWWKRRTPSR